MCIAVCLFSLSACGKAETPSPPVDLSTQLKLSETALSCLERFVKTPDGLKDETRTQFAKENEALAVGLDSWENVKHDLGALEGVYDNTKVAELENGYRILLHTQFEKRKMDFTVVTDQDGVVTSVGFAPQYTVAENMEKAFFNMILGMGTVFIVLIFISFLISRFKYINRFEATMKNRRMKGTSGQSTVLVQPVDRSEAENEKAEAKAQDKAAISPGDDRELVAVITAAIAASAGRNPSDLVVRSIRRSTASKWKKA